MGWYFQLRQLDEVAKCRSIELLTTSVLKTLVRVDLLLHVIG